MRRTFPHFILVVFFILSGIAPCAAQKAGQALADSLLSALPNVPQDHDTAKAALLIRLGSVFSTIDPNKGMHYCRQALALAQNAQWTQGIGHAYNTCGKCAVYQSDFGLALDYWNKAKEVFESIDDKRGILKAVGNIGAVYEYQGNYSMALQNHFQALKYAEELGDKPGIAINYGNIGSTYDYLKDYDKALEYNLKALALFRELGDRQNEAVYLGNIGNVYIDKGEYKQALKYEQQALAANDAIGNTEGIIRDLENTGAIYAHEANYNAALEYYTRALGRSQAGGFKVQEAKALSSIGAALLAVSKDTTGHATPLSEARLQDCSVRSPRKSDLLQAAIRYLRQSIAINEEVRNLNELLHDYYALSEAQRLAGLPADALTSRDRYFALKDSVFSLESKEQIARLEGQRELELKDKQIIIDRLAVAKKRNERTFFIAGIALLLLSGLIILRNVRLKNAKELSENKLQTFQARMNPHFIFNSLNSIQSLVLRGETKASMTYLSRFARLMRSILDGSAQSRIRLEQEIEMLRGYIELEKLRFSKFEYDIQIAPDFDPAAVEVPAMIIQPFVENAIIHGLLPKGEGARLLLTFERDGNAIRCVVDDNGIGRKASAERNAGRAKEHVSQGIAIAANRLALLTKKRKDSAQPVTYEDKESGGIATGTKVVLIIPVLGREESLTC